jgi:hypothetical protein
MNLNSKYKATVFTALFSDKANLLELYNAIKGSHYDAATTEISINTLQDTLFMSKINDISFTVCGKLIILIEHQSTLNPNMALRFLQYVGRVYEKIIDSKMLFRSSLTHIPKPEFIVLYNGTHDTPDEADIKLSDAFESLLPGEKPSLELHVKVYNINHGHNQAILQKSENLSGYAQFIARIRENLKTMSKPEAVKEAIDYCMRAHILSTFLKEHASEVENMLAGDWSLEEIKAIWQEEAQEWGYERGQKETLQKSKQEKRESARKMKAEGLSQEQIARFTGLPSDEIAGL